jgi:hypothetical protein
MFRSLLRGLANKAGETLGVSLWTMLFAAVASLLVWFGRPDQLIVSRRSLLLYGLLGIFLLMLAYVAGFLVAKQRYHSTVVVVDNLQRAVLCFLWLQPQNTIDFGAMHTLTGAHPSDLTLAGEQLQEYGLIAFQPTGSAALMQLLMAGREYIKAHSLDNAAAPMLAERMGRLDDQLDINP